MKKKIFILDMDETLLHTQSDHNMREFMRDPHNVNDMELSERLYFADIMLENDRNRGNTIQIWGVLRPHVKEFLEFLFENDYIPILHSAGTDEYVDIASLMPFKGTYHPYWVLGRSYCPVINGVHQKPFSKIIQSVPGLQEYAEAEIDASGKIKGYKNILILEDRRNAFDQDPHNGILIPVYSPEPTIEDMKKDDIRLLQLIEWLKRPEVIACQDYRLLDKSKIFI